MRLEPFSPFKRRSQTALLFTDDVLLVIFFNFFDLAHIHADDLRYELKIYFLITYYLIILRKYLISMWNKRRIAQNPGKWKIVEHFSRLFEPNFYNLKQKPGDDFALNTLTNFMLCIVQRLNKFLVVHSLEHNFYAEKNSRGVVQTSKSR